MDCLECKNLEETFESRLSKYIEACSAAYYRVSTELAAKKNVDMERARYDLEEHQFICVYVRSESRLSKYIEACSAAYYRVSTELAAKKNVDMERARYDLEEHQFICVYV